MSRSPVCDGPKFTLGLESAYRNMWHRYCKGDVPSQRHMEEQPEEVTTEEQDAEISEPTSTIPRESPPGSIKTNGFNPLPPPVLNHYTCEDNGESNGGESNGKHI